MDHTTTQRITTTTSNTITVLKKFQRRGAVITLGR